MRKPFQLSLDERFVREVDAARGMVPRSRWIEGMVEAGALDVMGGLPKVLSPEEQARLDAEDVSTNPPLSAAVREGTPRAFERSPGPPVDSGASRAPSTIPEPTWTGDPSPGAVSRFTGHREGCGCLKCERARGRIV